MKITQKEDVRTGSCGGHDIDSISIVWIEILEKNCGMKSKFNWIQLW